MDILKNKQENTEFVRWNYPELWKINSYIDMPAFCHERGLLVSMKDWYIWGVSYNTWHVVVGAQ